MAIHFLAVLLVVLDEGLHEFLEFLEVELARFIIVEFVEVLFQNLRAGGFAVGVVEQGLDTSMVFVEVQAVVVGIEAAVHFRQLFLQVLLLNVQVFVFVVLLPLLLLRVVLRDHQRLFVRTAHSHHASSLHQVLETG